MDPFQLRVIMRRIIGIVSEYEAISGNKIWNQDHKNYLSVVKICKFLTSLNT